MYLVLNCWWCNGVNKLRQILLVNLAFYVWMKKEGNYSSMPQDLLFVVQVMPEQIGWELRRWEDTPSLKEAYIDSGYQLMQKKAWTKRTIFQSPLIPTIKISANKNMK